MPNRPAVPAGGALTPARCAARERDLELLCVVGEQYAVTLPQLARMMGCSTHAARWLRSRWERAGWARGRALLVGEPVFVWLTRRGQTLAGIDYAVWRPNAGMLAHIAAVTDVRLHVRDRHPGALWVCERELHRERRPRRTYDVWPSSTCNSRAGRIPVVGLHRGLDRNPIPLRVEYVDGIRLEAL